MSTVSIWDVAEAAGVSTATVSYVLNDSHPVSEAKRERVLAAAERLGYRPNIMARSLQAQRTLVDAADAGERTLLAIGADDPAILAQPWELVCDQRALLSCFVAAWQGQWFALPFLVLYLLAFGWVGGLSLWQARGRERRPAVRRRLHWLEP